MVEKEIDLTQVVRTGDTPQLYIHLEKITGRFNNHQDQTLVYWHFPLPPEENVSESKMIHVGNHTFFFSFRVDWGAEARAREMEKQRTEWERQEYLRLKKKFEELEKPEVISKTKQEKLL